MWLRKVGIWLNELVNFVNLRYHKVTYDRGLKVNGRLKVCGRGTVSFGNTVTINSGKNYNCIGGDTRAVFSATATGFIKIGSNVGISNSTIVSQGPGIVIEDNVMIGGSCKIYDTDFHAIDYTSRMQFPDPNVLKAPVTIRKGAFIGAHSIILKGVTIGKKAVIGAGSVVTKNVPDGEIWAGNPVKFIKKVEMK